MSNHLANKKPKRDAATSPSRGFMSGKDILRWPVHLPTGHCREVQIDDIEARSPVIAYKSLPKAGTIYGLDTLHTRIEYLQTIASNYIPVLNSILKAEKPEKWHATFFPTVRNNGLKLLAFEYRNLADLFDSNTPKKITDEDDLKKITFTRSPWVEKYTAAQLIFGYDSPDHCMIQSNLDLRTGRLDGISRYENTYYRWVGEGPNGLYREYRFDLKWNFINYTLEYQDECESARCAAKFFDFAIKNSTKHSENWRLVRKSSHKFNQSLFASFSLCPARTIRLFEEYNFEGNHKWHRYFCLHHHKNRPNQMDAIKVTMLEEGIKTGASAAINDVVTNWKKDWEDLKPVKQSKKRKRLTMKDQSALVLTSYYKILQTCNARNIDMTNLEKVNNLPEYLDYRRAQEVLTPAFENTKPLCIERPNQYYLLLSKIELLSTTIESQGVKPNRRLAKILAEGELMRERFIDAVNLYSYRSKIELKKNKLMMGTVLLSALDHKNELSLFEKKMIKMVNAIAPQLGYHTLVDKFEENLCCVFDAPQVDDLLPIKDINRIFMINVRKLKQMFQDIKVGSLELGVDHLLYTSVQP